MKKINIIKENPIGTRPSWDEIMIHTAISWTSRSSCYNVHSATIISHNNHIIAEGYNGAPSSIKKNCLETGCRKKLKGLDYIDSLNCGECIGVHSELNAVGHLARQETDKICLYTTIFPCHTCAKNILPYSPKKVIFKRFYSKKELSSTLELFEEANVEVYQLDLSPKRYLDISFNHPNVTFDVWSKEEKDKIKNLMKLI